jgi:hypothetical protein
MSTERHPPARGLTPAITQARIGIVAGLLLGLFLNGLGSRLTLAPVHAAIADGVSLSEVATRLGDGHYRATLHCPVKNHRVTYQVRAENAGGAHMALEWVMPACQLSGLGRAQAAESNGHSLFRGVFHCPSDFYRKTVRIEADTLRAAALEAGAASPGCRVEIIDQTACPFLDPLCTLQSDDRRRDIELERTRLLR